MKPAIISVPYNTPPDIKAYREGYATGLREGARRERRALYRSEAKDWPKNSRYRQWIENWLASRRRKGGKNG